MVSGQLNVPEPVRRLVSEAGPAERLTLDFFGVRVRLHLEAGDVADARFFFGAHGAPGDGRRPDVDVWLWGDGGFYRSLLAKDEARKVVVVAERGGPPRLAADFRSWSGAPSPVPPFSTRALAARVMVARGSVVRAPSGATWCIVGPNYVGKTAATLALLERGFGLLSEHLLVVRRDDGRAERYLSPFGLRRQTLAALETAGRLHGLDRRATVSDMTGRVVLVQPDALFPGCGAEPAPVDGMVELVPAEATGLRGVGPTPALACYPRGTGAELSRRLPARCLRVGVAPGHPPASLASRLEDIVR
jgi:hypothetical protein